MYKYLAALVILFIIFFFYIHIIKITAPNNHLDILQVFDPEPELAYELLGHNQPIVFQRELEFWKDFNKLLGQPLETIKNKIATHSEVNYSLSIKMNLEPYNLPLSYDWLIDIRPVILDDTNGIFFIKQSNYLQMFGCVVGQFRIIITPPDQTPKLEPFTNYVSSKDATGMLDAQPIDLNYIEIIVRVGNLVYIPYGWHYFIYKPITNEGSSECVILDCLNKSAINIF
jgi:hypothetical protein